MTTTTPSAALIPVAPAFTNTERLALAGFLAGYSGLPAVTSPSPTRLQGPGPGHPPYARLMTCANT
jgi:hypothetical protein